MSSTQLSLADTERSRLRVLVAALEREVARLPPAPPASDGTKGADLLRSAWAELVAALALGAEPAVRECPVCKHVGMHTATICGYCWTKFAPLN